MEADQFRNAIGTRPFTIRTSSGEKYTVRHPETVSISPSGRTVAFVTDEGHAVFDMAAISEFVVTRSTPKKGGQ
jgi:hypothetical protein